MTPINAPILALPGIRHGFFTRQGGASGGIYASLNCGPGSGDDQAHVHENRVRVAAHFGQGPERLLTLYQTHSADTVVVRAPWEKGPEADALATAMPGLILCILTADCGPVLLADPKARVIGAAHAGWKGALSGIVESVVTAMESLGAARGNIRAALGPCMGVASYQVGPEFVARFAESVAGHERFFTGPDASGKPHFDLNFYVKFRLQESGINDIISLDLDTCADEARFFSYRRATLRGEPSYGRQISCIMLEN